SHTTAGLPTLLHHLPVAQTLARAILRTGSHLISKKQIRHLRSFRMGVVREGPDLGLFVHPGALVKLGRWVGEAVGVLEAEKNGGRKKDGNGKKGKEEEALVLAALNDARGVYVVVGLGGGSDGVGRVRSRKEIREREERRQRRGEAKAERKAEKARVREERRRLRREMREANGDLESEDEEDEEEEESSGSESDLSEDDSDSESEGEGGTGKRRKGAARNRFGQAFQEVVEETGARVRIDSFEHSVVEVRKEDLAGFLEGLSLKSVVG
ncbi:hypothetical protein KC322_g12642, partial [Hortaea werneckii]